MTERVDWERVAHAWRRLGEIPASDFDRLRDGLADEARALVDADWVAIMIVTLDEDPAGPLGGWRARVCESPHVEHARYLEMVRVMRSGAYLQDPAVGRLLVGLGGHRVIGRPPEAPSTAMRASLDGWGVSDQIIGIVALGPTVELYIAASRVGRGRAFSASEHAFLRAFLDGAVTQARHLVRSYGLLGPVSLTPRQRQAVAHLLRGMSEKEMAAELGISAATAHEYVVEVDHASFDAQGAAKPEEFRALAVLATGNDRELMGRQKAVIDEIGGAGPDARRPLKHVTTREAAPDEALGRVVPKR